MSDAIQSGLFLAIGAVGLAGFGLVPYRSWLLLQALVKRGRQRPAQMALYGLTFALIIAALAIDLLIASRIYQCLNEAYCGPNVASGWIYLSWLGAVYLVFELGGYVMRRAYRALRVDTAAGEGKA